MINKIFYKLKNEGLVSTINAIFLKIKLIFKIKEFTVIKEFRSESDDGDYPKVVSSFINDSRKFKNFKRNSFYRRILEHVSYEQGKEYIKIIQRDNPQFIDEIEKFKFNDIIGNPYKFDYPQTGTISPTTLRYLKVASDLKKIFGNIGNEIAEIGCGYGGQFLILDKIFSFNKYYIFDLSIVNKLIEKYIESFVVISSYETLTINKFDGKKQFDFVISNYAFSEVPKLTQITYLKKIILNSKKGYITMNSGVEESACKNNHLSLEEIKSYLPNIKTIKEEPNTHKGNYILVWQ